MVDYKEVRHVSTEEYFKNNAFAVDMFENKYAHKIGDRKETPAEVFYRIADNLSKFEDDPEYYKNIWFDMMYTGWFRPGGSIISALGSGKKISTLNCTTIPIETDTLEGIIRDSEYAVAKCAAYRQGIGIDLSVLRPRGSKVGNAAELSDGVVPWGTKYSEIGKYVGQRGRMPALLESLKIHHPDIEEFINCKRIGGRIENANLSVQIGDDFMSVLKVNGQYLLFFETDYEKIEREVSAEYLFDLIAEAAHDSAEPAVQFIDKLRKGSMVHAIYVATGDGKYKIISTNACCFTENMEVTTDKGVITISDIKEKFNNGEQLNILSYDITDKRFEFQELEAVHVRDNETPQEIIELCIEKDDGTEVIIECTPDHKIYTQNRGYVKAIELDEDDILLEH